MIKALFFTLLLVAALPAIGQTLPNAKPINRTVALPAGGAAAYTTPSTEGVPAKQLTGKVQVLEGNRTWVRVQTKDSSAYFLPAWVVGMQPKRCPPQPGPTDSVTCSITYTGVVQVPGVSQAALYARAAEWMAKVYNSSKAVIELNDPQNGKIIGNGAHIIPVRTALVWPDLGYAEYSISIFCKDGRYKYTITRLRHLRSVHFLGDYGAFEQEHTKLGDELWNYMKLDVTSHCVKLVSELAQVMTKKADSDF